MRKRHVLMILLLLLVCLLVLIECHLDEKDEKGEKAHTSDSKFYIERTDEPKTYPPITIVPGINLDEPDEIE